MGVSQDKSSSEAKKQHLDLEEVGKRGREDLARTSIRNILKGYYEFDRAVMLFLYTIARRGSFIPLEELLLRLRLATNLRYEDLRRLGLYLERAGYIKKVRVEREVPEDYIFRKCVERVAERRDVRDPERYCRRKLERGELRPEEFLEYFEDYRICLERARLDGRVKDPERYCRRRLFRDYEVSLTELGRQLFVKLVYCFAAVHSSREAEELKKEAEGLVGVRLDAVALEVCVPWPESD